MNVEIIGVGVFRQIMQSSKMQIKLDTTATEPPTVHTVLETLDDMCGGQFSEELYLEDGSPNLWTRVMLNGRDIRFMDEDKHFVQEGDTVLISSVMAGG